MPPKRSSNELKKRRDEMIAKNPAFNEKIAEFDNLFNDKKDAAVSAKPSYVPSKRKRDLLDSLSTSSSKDSLVMSQTILKMDESEKSLATTALKDIDTNVNEIISSKTVKKSGILIERQKKTVQLDEETTTKTTAEFTALIEDKNVTKRQTKKYRKTAVDENKENMENIVPWRTQKYLPEKRDDSVESVKLSFEQPTTSGHRENASPDAQNVSLFEVEELTQPRTLRKRQKKNFCELINVTNDNVFDIYDDESADSNRKRKVKNLVLPPKKTVKKEPPSKSKETVGKNRATATAASTSTKTRKRKVNKRDEINKEQLNRELEEKWKELEEIKKHKLIIETVPRPENSDESD